MSAEAATERLLGSIYEAMVFGPAQAQGSKKVIKNAKTGRLVMLEMTDHKRHWRQEMISAMIEDRPQYPLDSAVEMKLVAYVPRPRAHYNSKHALKPNAPLFAKTGKDGDKIQRAVGDAAKIAGWVLDDSRIAHWDFWRLYAEMGEPERTVVTMRELTEYDAVRLGLVLKHPEESLLTGLQSE